MPYDPTCGCRSCDRYEGRCPACRTPMPDDELESGRCGECGHTRRETNPRERGEDDGVEYGDPRDEEWGF